MTSRRSSQVSDSKKKSEKQDSIVKSAEHSKIDLMKESYLQDYATKVKTQRLEKIQANFNNSNPQHDQSSQISIQTSFGHLSNNATYSKILLSKVTPVSSLKAKKSYCSQLIMDLNQDIRKAKVSSQLLPQIDLQPPKIPKNIEKNKKIYFEQKRFSNLSSQAASMNSTAPVSSCSRRSASQLKDTQVLKAQNFITKGLKTEQKFQNAAKSILKIMSDFNTQPFNNGQEFHFKLSYL